MPRTLRENIAAADILTETVNAVRSRPAGTTIEKALEPVAAKHGMSTKALSSRYYRYASVVLRDGIDAVEKSAPPEPGILAELAEAGILAELAEAAATRPHKVTAERAIAPVAARYNVDPGELTQLYCLYIAADVRGDTAEARRWRDSILGLVSRPRPAPDLSAPARPEAESPGYRTLLMERTAEANRLRAENARLRVLTRTLLDSLRSAVLDV